MIGCHCSSSNNHNSQWLVSHILGLGKPPLPQRRSVATGNAEGSPFSDHVPQRRPGGFHKWPYPKAGWFIGEILLNGWFGGTPILGYFRKPPNDWILPWGCWSRWKWISRVVLGPMPTWTRQEIWRTTEICEVGGLHWFEWEKISTYQCHGIAPEVLVTLVMIMMIVWFWRSAKMCKTDQSVFVTRPFKTNWRQKSTNWQTGLTHWRQQLPDWANKVFGFNCTSTPDKIQSFAHRQQVAPSLCEECPTSMPNLADQCVRAWNCDASRVDTPRIGWFKHGINPKSNASVSPS